MFALLFRWDNLMARDEARHLLHIASTRTAYQLWLVCSGDASPLVPQKMIDEASSEETTAVR
ncbi:MAG: hypothetical protein KC457_00730 [Myxococcales bacterium]|nr:hypothetical protein [Myxococcales bacterium]